MTTRNPVGWFEIHVSDLPRARAFYETVLGTRFERLDSPPGAPLEMLAFAAGGPDAAGASGALVRMEGGPAGGGASTIVYFVCDDVAVEAGRVEAAGGRLQQPKTSIGPYGFIAMAVDTEGNVLGLHSMR
jgi:predicted enzyme related to lactoylglutathione lyase